MIASIPRVYLAGPNVFRPDAIAFGATLKHKCQKAGLVGCFPLDNEITGATPRETAQMIYEANVRLIDSSHGIIADISPFRGPNMDPGTAWEIGYGIAKGLPVFAWTNAKADLLDRTSAHKTKLERTKDTAGWEIENFGLTENLMIALSALTIHASDDDAIAACAARFKESWQ